MVADDALREEAQRNGHRWWPCSKRGLNDYPTDCDRKQARQPLALTSDDFTPVPSVDGAFYAPDGRIVYTHERDAMIESVTASKWRKIRQRFSGRKGH